jgi:hypothetical protein
MSAVALPVPGLAAVDDLVPVIGDVETCLRELIEELGSAPAVPRGRGRPALLPAVCLWGGRRLCVLQGATSQLAIWRLITQLGLWQFPRIAVSDQALYHRLARSRTHPLEVLLRQFSTLLAARLTPYLPHLGPELAPFASEIVALDETTLDPVARRLGTATGAAPSARRLPGKLAGVFDVRRQLWRTVQLITEVHQNEKVAARALLTDLPRGTLVLADLGYFGFQWFDDLTDAGYFWLSRLRTKTSYRIEHVFYQCGDTFDGLVWLGAYRADRTKHLVRLVQYRQGPHLHRYVTNVRDPHRLPLAQLVALYARRWDIELAVNLVKEHLGLHLWWSAKDVVIEQQLFAVLIIAQILQALRLEIAARAQVDLFDVSLPLLVRCLPQLMARGEDPVAFFVERGRAAGFIRSHRRHRCQTPDPPLEVAWPLRSITFRREPRYAQRKTGSRQAA